MVYGEFCQDHTKCIANMSVYLHSDLSTLPDLTESKLKDLTQSYVRQKISEPITSVNISSNLDEAVIESIIARGHEELFFISNNLYVNPTKVQNPDVLAAELSALLNIDTETLKNKFKIRAKQHLEIIRKMSIGTRDAVTKRIATERQAVKEGQLEEKNSIYPFIKIEDNLIRYYPEGDTSSQITGFVDGEGRGRYGVEGYFENVLQIESPIQTVIKDTAGRPIRDYVSENSLTLKSGVDITLTIDRNIQKEISHIADIAVQKYRANRISVIVMNPKTGAVVSMVNAPTFNSNDFTDVYDMEMVSYATYPNPPFDLMGYPLFVVDSQSGSTLANIDGKRLKLRGATEDEIANFAIMKYKFKNGFGDGNYKNDVI